MKIKAMCPVLMTTQSLTAGGCIETVDPMLSVALAKVRQLKITGFWNKTPYSLLDIDRRFGE
jgi:hypothetical protein